MELPIPMYPTEPLTRSSPRSSSGSSPRPPAAPRSYLPALLLVSWLAASGIVEAPAQPVQPAEAEPLLPWVAPAPPPRSIALILPLSGRQQALGRAVRDGFMAAHLAAGSPADVEFVVLDEVQGAANAYQVALAGGTGIIVGPLLKESVQALAGLVPAVPVLALNYLPDGLGAPADFYQFGLAPEDETREVARRALALGQRRALALVPDNDWGRRLLAAFTAEYTAGGGVVLDAGTYDATSTDFAGPIQGVLGGAAGQERHRRLQAFLRQPLDFEPGPRPDADLIFLGANSGAARQIRPQLLFFGAGQVPLYATSAIYEDGAPADPDLNGIQFPDTPWTIAANDAARAVKESLRRYGPAGALGVSRLYALGYDAYALAPQIRDRQFVRLPLAGVTGTLSMAPDGRVERRLPWAEIRGGEPSGLPPVAYGGPVDDPGSLDPGSLGPGNLDPGDLAPVTRSLEPPSPDVAVPGSSAAPPGDGSGSL